MCSNSEAIDLVSLFVEAQDRLLVDVVRRDDGELAEPGQLETFGDSLESLPR